MGFRKLSTNKEVTAITSTEIVTGDNTIISALEKVLIESKECQLDEAKLVDAHDAFSLLENRLHFTHIQSMVISMLVDYDGSLSTKNMANYLDTRNIQIITHMPEITDLIERRIIRKVKEHGNSVEYIMVPAAAQAYMKNEEYIAPSDENLTLTEFFERVDNYLEQRSDRVLDIKELHNELSDLIQKNKTLSVCKWIAEHNIDNQTLFLFCCREYINNGDTDIHWHQYQGLFERNTWGRITSGITSGFNPLFKDGLIEHHGREGLMGNSNSITASSEIRQKLSEELGIAWECDDAQENCAGLLKHEDICDKKLYYNSHEKEAVDKLKELLQQEQFEAIQSRLAASGMRKGFACLFFGSPGTGKTETVLQLAKTTGRNILQVNITDIKSKWVGESEQNIKKVFERYRKLCQKCAKQPILLFNEADAIIGARMEHITRSVDKMENAIQNIILEEMEKLEGILIATTNLTSNMDKAFERRFLYKVEFTRPSLEARQHIWQSMIPTLSSDDAHHLASEYSLSGGQIENIARKRMVDYILYDKPTSLDTLRHYCDSESMEHMQSKRAVLGFR